MEVSLNSILTRPTIPSSGDSFSYKGSNKHFIFDMNNIQNKLPGADLRGPSTKNF